jgi:hypothetical protein
LPRRAIETAKDKPMASRKTTQKAPWDKGNPKKKSTPLSGASKKAAKRSAQRAGRPYPNLVDNMNAARKQKTGAAKKTATKKATAKKATAKKKPATKKKPAEKDPRGGLTAAGRRALAERDGARLKPGVQTKGAAMTAQDMQRKGSWAVRFYGRKQLPALVDAHGEPTRFALSAHAWGEPVPRTEAAARRIAAKGRKLLERYRAAKDGG